MLLQGSNLFVCILIAVISLQFVSAKPVAEPACQDFKQNLITAKSDLSRKYILLIKRETIFPYV